MNIRRTARITPKPASRPLPFEAVREAVASDPFWEGYLHDLSSKKPCGFSVHLAVFVEPFLQYVLDGRKTIESRFSAVRCPPYRRVKSGDVILLKRSGGPVVGICEVGQVWSYNLDPDSWEFVRKEFAEALCAQDPEFWKAREHASYATLMQVRNVRPVQPLVWEKRDRRGWVVLQVGTNATLFEDLMKTTVLGFSGGIKSGKSTVSEAVALGTECPRVSFGGYVRTVTRQRGLEGTRENWQAVGESLIQEDVKQFCASVLAQADWEPGRPLVIDGIRHLVVVETLKQMVAPSDFKLVYISTEDALRAERHQESAPNQPSLPILEKHSTEREVRTALRQAADLVADGERPVSDLVTEITAFAAKLH